MREREKQRKEDKFFFYRNIITKFFIEILFKKLKLKITNERCRRRKKDKAIGGEENKEGERETKRVEKRWGKQ